MKISREEVTLDVIEYGENKEHSISVQHWSNWDGVTVCIQGRKGLNDVYFDLTHTDVAALQAVLGAANV